MLLMLSIIFMAVIHTSLAGVASSQAHSRDKWAQFGAGEGVNGMVNA